MTVANGNLEVFKSWKDLNGGQPPTKSLDLMLCSEKLDADAKDKHTFTVTSNDKVSVNVCCARVVARRSVRWCFRNRDADAKEKHTFTVTSNDKVM